MLLPLPRATASVELVGSRSISYVAAAAEHHVAVLENRKWMGWRMRRTAGEVSALAGDVEEGEEIWRRARRCGGRPEK